MTELSPRVIYSPETKHLTLRATPDPEFTDRIQRDLVLIDGKPGYEVAELADGDFSLDVDIDQVIEERDDPYEGHSADELIATLGSFGHLHYKDPRDGVVSVGMISNWGLKTPVYHQFQSWLNEAGLNEAIARETITSMAQPFGTATLQEIMKLFEYREGPLGSGGFTEGWMKVTSRLEGLKMYDTTTEGDAITERLGKADWRVIDLTTDGSCACFGLDGNDKSHIRVDSDRTKDLYELKPHNVDHGIQSLSLLLGLGNLARHAASYTPNQDLLESVEWYRHQTF